MNDSPGWTILDSPIGPLTVVTGLRGITNIHFDGTAPPLPQEAMRPIADATDQLEAYFAGERQAFELELDLRGSDFQQAVWRRLLAIPYGATTTYGEIAAGVADPAYPSGTEPHEQPRLVGAAVGRNPVPVVVGCHRVIGADGSLTGYFGGLERKRLLLDLERGITTL